MNKKYAKYKNVTGRPSEVEIEVNELLETPVDGYTWEPFGPPHTMPLYADKAILIIVQPMVLVCCGD